MNRSTVLTIRYGIGSTPVGPVLVASTEKGLCSLKLAPRNIALAELRRWFPRAELIRDDRSAAPLLKKLRGLMNGEDAGGLGIPLDLRGTAFQQRVWQELGRIPAGTTCSYSELARRVGRPRAVRAVANACACNPIAILVPCHRVLRSDGSLGGYRWGPGIKRQLLQHEGSSFRANSLKPTGRSPWA